MFQTIKQNELFPTAPCFQALVWSFSDLMSKFQTSCRFDELLEISASFLRAIHLIYRLVWWTHVPRNTGLHQAETSCDRPDNGAHDHPSSRLTAEWRLGGGGGSRCSSEAHQEERTVGFMFELFLNLKSRVHNVSGNKTKGFL